MDNNNDEVVALTEDTEKFRVLGGICKKSGFPGESLLLFCHSAGCLVGVGSWELDAPIPLQNTPCFGSKTSSPSSPHRLPVCGFFGFFS